MILWPPSNLPLRSWNKSRRWKFHEHFVVRRNFNSERAKFQLSRQENDATVETFITALHALAEYCDYGTLKDEMIRDRIVESMQVQTLSDKLQLVPELYLTKAISQSRQSEAVLKQALLRNDFKEVEDSKKGVDAVEVKAKNTQKLKDENGPKSKKPPPKKSPTQPSLKRCERCGNSPSRENCPAKDATCYKC